ncbi:hypothetical protein TNCV_4953331 [Trichonephila clavipes]|nr:hypothetical protein TNCV_4953331 [Trichonephila clavipes]
MPKRVVSFRAGLEREPLNVYRDCNTYGTHPYPLDCRRISSYCAIFAVSRSLVGRDPLCTPRFDHRRKKKPFTACNVGGDSRYPSPESNYLTGLGTLAAPCCRFQSSKTCRVEGWIRVFGLCGLLKC